MKGAYMLKPVTIRPNRDPPVTAPSSKDITIQRTIFKSNKEEI